MSKKNLLETCELRNDEWGDIVQVRIEGAISDLHASDARYHVDCRTLFSDKRNISSLGKGPSTTDKSNDTAFSLVIEEIQENPSRLWNTVELFKKYVEHGGNTLSRRLLVQNLPSYFGNDLLVLSSPGIASIVGFRNCISNTMKLIDDYDDEGLNPSMSRICKQIKEDIDMVTSDKSHYDAHISIDTMIGASSETLLDLLAKISPQLSRTLPSLLICNVVTSIVKNHPTSMQIDLGVLIRDSKRLINMMHSFGVTCSYDEVLRFKKSAAVLAATNTEVTGISNAKSGLIQIVADNFDADISSQNGKLTTHSLAVLVTQPDTNQDQSDIQLIKRIKKANMPDSINYELPIQRFTGHKTPVMQKSVKCVQPLSILAHEVIASNSSHEFDFQFICDILNDPNCPEYNGYMTARSRLQGHSIQPRTIAVYLPLIDMVPSDPDTIMTALVQAQRISTEAGQDFVVFTCDQQLYRVMLQVIWSNVEQFSNVVPRLGGMHTLMSFIGTVGTLMAETGLSDVLGAVFGGVPKLLSGKKFPQNVRALRLVTEELLRSLFEHNPGFTCYTDLMSALEIIACSSKTSKVWIDILIKPVFIMMQFVRAEREGHWLLHLHAMRQMIPYFFAAGHIHYARYGLYYLRSMEALPDDVQQHFLKGEHVMRHNSGIWNGIWSDMYIETTFMRYILH